MERFSSLPAPIRFLAVTIPGGGAIASLYLFYPKAVLILLIGLLGAALILAIYLFALHLVNRRRAAGMTGEISQHTAVAPRGISDPAQRAKLDDLRRKFQEGVAKFRAAGRDLYSVPWYLLIGEAGAGKTEAIRHCNVGFPPGLQDEMQGVGGTINMNWWFLKEAIILDTAGNMVFPEVGAAGGPEWDSFLALLRKSRRNCPINGLLLVLPADSLIKDNADQIAAKAGRIAAQLNKIQRSLDVRFPVFIFITKCDLINGFREFFNNIADPALQHQMLGWSNPSALDDPFKPELVDQHFQIVVQRLRRRRMGLIQDPTPQNDPQNGRRIDEIDALFSLPASMELLAPRLRRYLELVFTPNEWQGGKPLFLRGIYFSSAMREGSALDLELAEAIGVPVDSLPEGKTWEKERAYFLRDLFTEKIFRERGLVTGASNTRRMLRRRQAVLFGCGFFGLTLLLIASWFGARALRDSVGLERDYWIAASTGWKEGQWNPIVAPEYKGSASFIFNGTQEIAVGQESVRLDKFHSRLAELSRSDIKVPWVFKPMDDLVAGANTSRKRAQRIVFEGGVIVPLVQAAREKVMNSRDKWTPASSEALAFLIRLEGMLANRGSGLTSDEISAGSFFAPLGRFLYNDPKPDADLAAAFNWVYLDRGDGRGTWPPPWLSAGFNLHDNRAIAVGLDAFVRHTQDSSKAQAAGFDQIKSVRVELRRLKDAEDAALQAASASGTPAAQASEALAEFLRQKDTMDQAIASSTQNGLFSSGQLSLFDSYTALVEEARRQTEAAFKLIQNEIDRFQPGKGAVADPSFTLPAEIRRRMLAVEQDIKSQAEGTFTPDEIVELKGLDRRFLDKDAAGNPLYGTRARLYQLALAQVGDSGDSTATMLGNFGRLAGGLQASINAVRDNAAHYQGSYAAESERSCGGFSAKARPTARRRFTGAISPRSTPASGVPPGFPWFWARLPCPRRAWRRWTDSSRPSGTT